MGIKRILTDVTPAQQESISSAHFHFGRTLVNYVREDPDVALITRYNSRVNECGSDKLCIAQAESWYNSWDLAVVPKIQGTRHGSS